MPPIEGRSKSGINRDGFMPASVNQIKNKKRKSPYPALTGPRSGPGCLPCAMSPPPPLAWPAASPTPPDLREGRVGGGAHLHRRIWALLAGSRPWREEEEEAPSPDPCHGGRGGGSRAAPHRIRALLAGSRLWREEEEVPSPDPCRWWGRRRGGCAPTVRKRGRRGPPAATTAKEPL
jgi:hypothetical protein